MAEMVIRSPSTIFDARFNHIWASSVTRKPVFKGSEQVRLKPVCSTII